MNSFFQNCNSVEQAKVEYRKLAKIHHPDFGGDVEVMKDLNNAFEAFCKGEFRREGHGEETVGNKFNAVAEVMAQAMRFARISADIHVEVCGIWIWLTGDTKSHKEAIKAAGDGLCRWSQDKKAWYWKPEWCRKQSRRVFGLDEIRDTFGSQKVDGQEQWVA